VHDELTTDDPSVRLAHSLLLFTRYFFQERTGRAFDLSYPIARESHYITICRALMDVFEGKTKRLIINVAPRSGKTELLIHFIAWALARYPDCNFLYTSYSHNLAARQTAIVRNILLLNEYKQLFPVSLAKGSQAKFDFETDSGGSVYAAGIGGSILGRGAGIKGSARFGGCIIIDDAHKPVEVHSDVVREGVIEWYKNTLQSRRNNGRNTPTIMIAQRLHEHDLCAYLMEEDSESWEILKLNSLGPCGHALYPEIYPLDMLLDLQEHDPYFFAAQHQQDPQPAGGGVFKRDWFLQLEDEPKMLLTFITADTAETDKDYNDATVCSFWGVYKIMQGEYETDMYAIHWIDCTEEWVEPTDLQEHFMQFYYRCMHHKVRPSFAAIEKKSTGVTLLSTLQKIQGLKIVSIERTRASGSKTTRFLEMQKFIAKKQLTLPEGKKHTKLCIDHMAKITANDTHRRDDICDTAYDAIKLTLIDDVVINTYINPETEENKAAVDGILQQHDKLQQLRRARTW